MKKILAGIVAIIISIASVSVPVMATDSATTFGVETAVLKSCNSGGSQGIFCVLNMVVDILSGIIGVLGVLGITIMGVQYLTAGGNEERMKKSKKRLIEIIIGLVAYVAGYAVLKWLIPDFNTNSSGSSSMIIIETALSSLCNVFF